MIYYDTCMHFTEIQIQQCGTETKGNNGPQLELENNKLYLERKTIAELIKQAYLITHKNSGGGGGGGVEGHGHAGIHVQPCS